MMDISVYAADLAATYDKTALLFTKEKADSDYIGDGYQWKAAGSTPCSILPATDKLTAEVYGPRVEHMMLLHAAPGAPITDGMGIALAAGAAEPEYTVVSAKKRMTHTYALIEAIDNGSKS